VEKGSESFSPKKNDPDLQKKPAVHLIYRLGATAGFVSSAAPSGPLRKLLRPLLTPTHRAVMK